MIEIGKFLETVEKHGSNDLSDSCETCVQIKNGIKIIDEALKLRELIKTRIKQLDESIQEQVKLITNIQNKMLDDIIGFRHERFEEQISNHQQVINIFKDEMNTLQSLVGQSEK